MCWPEGTSKKMFFCIKTVLHTKNNSRNTSDTPAVIFLVRLVPEQDS